MMSIDLYCKLQDYKEGNYNLNACSLNTLSGCCPTHITGDFYCSTNPITSLFGCPDIVNEGFYAHGTEIISLHGIGKDYLKSIGGVLSLKGNKIESHVLGLLRLERLDHVGLDNYDVMSIINKHLHHGKDILDCQEELIQFGFKNFAKL